MAIRRARRGGWGAAAAALVALALAGAIPRAGAIAVTEFALPVANSNPLGVAAGPDGNIWFTEVVGSRVGRVTPAGNVVDFSTGSGVSTGGAKWDITAGPDGNLWYTDQANRAIGRISPLAAGQEFTTGIVNSPRGIAAGPDGNLWYAGDPSAVGRITTAGVVTEFTTGIAPGSRPLDIAAGPDGNLWFTEFQGDRIGRITPQGVVTEFSAGITAGAQPSGITAGPDGALWFTERQKNAVGRITTAGVVTEFSAGISSGTLMRSIVAGPDGNLWFTEPSLRRIGRITPAGQATEYPVTLAANGTPEEITAGPGRTLWVSTAAGNRVARLLLEPAATTGGASAITTTSARVAGTIDPFASSTGYVVEYGRTTAYGAATDSRIVLPSAGPVPVEVPLSGLEPGTLYHYRLVASSFGGTTTGQDATFTTAGTPRAGGGAPVSQDRLAPRMRIGRAPLVVVRGRVSISLGCPLHETLGCRGVVRLERPPVVRAGRTVAALRLGRAAFRIGGGQTRAIAIRLTPQARALVRTHPALRVRVLATAVDAAGNRAVAPRRLVLRARPA